jgi:C-terminal processing protease CtpA/Prc
MKFITAALPGLLALHLSAAAAAAALSFEELRAVIQTNLPGVTPTEVEQRAAEGLLHAFRGKVQLIDPAAEARTPTNIATSTVIDGGIGYVRVTTVSPGLPAQLTQHLRALATTNQLKGLVLDLRFAQGHDYAAAAAVADLFVTDARELLDAGTGPICSSAKTNAFTAPVVALVNGETAGAPEALAALLRETGVGLILGQTTIGAAMTTKELSLAGGQLLRIAAAPVRLAGGAIVPTAGVVPDISVTVPAAAERAYWQDPYTLPAHLTAPTNTVAGATNRSSRRTRTNEADLVRARREGVESNEDPMRREPEPETPVIRDPALGRAVDLLKGLAVVRRPS